MLLKHSRSSIANRNLISFWILVAPAILLFSVIMVWPLVNMFLVSTLDWRGLAKPSTFVGLQNYFRLFEQEKFYDALRNTAIHIGIALPFTIFPAFMLGYFLNKRFPGYRVLRTIFFTPSMLSGPALAMLFLGLYLPEGIINFTLRALNLDHLTRVWLADPQTSLGAIIATDLWAGIGFYAVLFFVAISSIPNELFEAAKMDGASEWGIMWKIVFPIIIDFVGVSAMLHFMYLLLGSAQIVLLLTGGGPGTSSLTLGYYLYQQAFQVRLLGYSQAIGVFVFFTGLMGMFLIRRVTAQNF